MQCFRIPFKPYCSKMAKRDTYSNTTAAANERQRQYLVRRNPDFVDEVVTDVMVV